MADQGVVRKSVKVNIPIDRYPQYNFVGRLLGPRGSTLKQLQRETNTWIRIRGRGSMRDKQEEARIRNNPGNEHLLEPLHVHIEAKAPPGAVDALLASAESKVSQLLIPVEESKDTHKKEQLRQLAQVRMAESMGGSYTAGQPVGTDQYQDPYATAAQYAAYYNPYNQQAQQFYAAYYQQMMGQQGGDPAGGPPGAPAGGAPAGGAPGAAAAAAAAAPSAPGTASAAAPPAEKPPLPLPEIEKQLAELKEEQKQLGSLGVSIPHCVRLLEGEVKKLEDMKAKYQDGGGSGPVRNGNSGDSRYHPYRL
mmetsp:Transcript_11816/g.21592  ORF Transcript_11816/g.21592 Transcript_11816/m.21592 type:complete len:307 (+) Transcript_11816:121-1041(+)|eukprot:CAMPEP_0197526232 /NCGR_PEP_ID=MMETSP1318-20131121/16892_1 /TAXON_ID=552666 /ORGANISM="Partenskyella glossopodia, Strain RCC365" /LENGTH=306 /DNA_ID=CAMNT_0043080303 /DNA_START=63 /DNA_END=983 /DNA_ORIENTATION=+